MMDLRKLVGFYVEHVRLCKERLPVILQRKNLPMQDWYLPAFMPNLMDKLFGITHKVLIAQYKLISSSASFDEYCESLHEEEVRQYFFTRYPVMRRWMDLLVEQWLQQSSLLIERFERDQEIIKRDLFHSGDALRVQEVKFGMGDAHRGGRSVACVELTDGRKLIYKPRNLDIDIHFSQLVQWLNQLGKLDLRTPATLHREDYGWVEFVASHACENQAEVGQYYFRLGLWLRVVRLP